MSLDNINTFSENIALFFNGRVPQETYELIKKEIRAKGKKIIPILYRTEEELLTSKVGINLSDEFYVINARPLNERTERLIDYAEKTNKKCKIFNDLGVIL